MFATWTSHANRAPDATYTVHHVDALDQPTTSAVSVNQRSNGGSQQSLGSYRFLAGTATVTLDQSANGYAIADGVSVSPVGALPNRAEWSFITTNAGDYLISAKWTAHPNRATNARYVIDYVDNVTGLPQSQAVVVNQQASGGVFNTLATLDLQAGSTVTVTLSDEANGYVIADAVQLVEVATSGPNRVIWPFSLAQSGTYEVYARWTAHPNRASNATYTITNGTTTQQVPVNQQINGGDWQLLATLTLDASEPFEITLTDVADGYVIADGVELRRQGSDAGLHFVHNDHLGTPQVITDAAQQVAWQGDYEPFGEVDETISTILNPLRFPGQYEDGETGLNYNYFRDYDPSTGRYVQSDPIGLAGGINTYEYSQNNPIGVYDPRGLAPNPGCVAACTVGGGVIGGGLGFLGGGLLGGSGGTLVAPGVGTVGGAISGAELGGAVGAVAGSAVGNAAGQAFCPDDDLEDRCDNQYYNVDIPTCRGISRSRGPIAAQR